MAEYHDYLQQKYGTAREIFTGVHVNYSINQTLVQSLWDFGFNEDFATLADFKNALNFKLAQSFVLWRWLFTYFLGPVQLPAICQAIYRVICVFRFAVFAAAHMAMPTKRRGDNL